MIKRKTFLKRAPKRRKKPQKAPTVSRLTKDLDSVFSKFIRYSRARDGIVECYTCGHGAEVKKIHAGHYVTRFYKAVRWDENNVRPQCFMCNIYRKGNAVIFRQKLLEEVGQAEVERIEKAVNMDVRGFLKIEYLQNQINHYTELIHTLV